MAEKSQVFEKTYNDYLIRIAGLDFNFIMECLAMMGMLFFEYLKKASRL